MFKIELDEAKYRRLVELLGSAEGVFNELAKTHTGRASDMFEERENECKEFITDFSEQFNKQFKA